MQQPPESPVKSRLRVVRRRITAAVLATFVAAWLAVAAFGKGGATSTTSTTSADPSTGTSSQSDDGAGYGPAAGDDDWGGDGSDSAQSGDSSAERRLRAEPEQRRPLP